MELPRGFGVRRPFVQVTEDPRYGCGWCDYGGETARLQRGNRPLPAEGAEVLLTPFAEYHEAPKTATPQPPRHPTTVPAIVACAAAALALLIADQLAHQSFISPQMRGLTLVVIISAAVVGATVWIDRRQIARHREILAMRKPGDCCAIAWVEGMAHRPFPGMSFPPGAQG